MKSYKEYLLEILKNSYDFDYVDDDQYTFETDKRITYKVGFVDGEYIKDYEGFEKYNSLTLAEIFFYIKRGDFNLSNTKDQYKVFSTIISIIESYVKNSSVDVIVFISKKSEKSRTSLYEKIINKLGKKYEKIYDEVEDFYFFMVEVN